MILVWYISWVMLVWYVLFGNVGFVVWAWYFLFGYFGFVCNVGVVVSVWYCRVIGLVILVW